MANINWDELGAKDAENEAPRKTEGFPDESAQNEYNEGFNNKWWEKGNDDARASREQRTDLPKDDAQLVIHYSDGYQDGEY